jgi:hypothetical protein
MSAVDTQGTFCRFADQVRGEAVAFSEGRLTREEFAAALLDYEAQTLRPNNVTLAVSHTEDGWITVMLKQNGTGNVRAAFEFLPEGQIFRPFSHLSSYPPRSLPRRSTKNPFRETGARARSSAPPVS